MRRGRNFALFSPVLSAYILNTINLYFFRDAGFTIQTLILILEIIIAVSLGVIGIWLFYKPRKNETDKAFCHKKKAWNGRLFKAVVFLVIVGFAILYSIHDYFTILGHWNIASTVALIHLAFSFVFWPLTFWLMFGNHRNTEDDSMS